MTNDKFESTDWQLLRYFSIIAEEGSMRRAAERLYMTQPPLSRHMKRLEEILGLTLFARHNKGLTLTSDGQAVLHMVRPVLEAQDAAGRALLEYCQHRASEDVPLAVGLSTAFEQGVFSGFMRHMHTHWQGPVQYVRQSSPQLARAVRQGKLDAALVALPLDAPGLHVCPLPYAEPMLAALPAPWVQAEQQRVRLQDMNDRALFWFRRETNPAFFDHMRGLFAHMDFAPQFIEEPEEYDVLLARIAQAEGMALLPRSFSAIGRQGVVFLPIEQGSLMQMRLGLIRPASQEGQDAGVHVCKRTKAKELQEILTAATGHLGG